MFQDVKYIQHRRNSSEDLTEVSMEIVVNSINYDGVRNGFDLNYNICIRI